jgi:hypothetical protein
VKALILGPLPILKTLRDKEPFSRHGGIQKERMVVPWAGRRTDGGFRFRRSGFPIMKAHNRRAHSGLQLVLVHRFWSILGGILAGFIILEQVL